MNLMKGSSELAQLSSGLIPQELCCALNAKATYKRDTAVTVSIDLIDTRPAVAVGTWLGVKAAEEKALAGKMPAVRTTGIDAGVN
jgi:hypothetical protein